ncbi:uncharacterized protein PRCAT00004094001 [Priceomyces carsonii]|uniref:uncharacterized protein n=1 Tax=Priceomyces carsonii TaxID=28549 RepID=UPI002ED7E9BE|nr:unnamed protein product [Priceomyces carsonii]
MVMASSNQASVLESSLNSISHQSSLMKQCLADNNILQALKHCSNFLNELRTSLLSPKQYYELYIAVFDSLEVLSSHLLASRNSKQKRKPANTPFLADLYELVQYSGNIIPRLYMMVVIGTTYMSTKDAPVKEIMKDLIEMCRGVQHPIRGLFLRYYLSQRTKDLLPLSTEEDFNETVNFLISNFIEMNKLWVRLQHQGHSSERELRYNERKELKILVGSNLVRLSQIIDDYSGDKDYSSVKYYQKKIFPVITEQIIQCRDHLAQSYLVDVLIQIFPDDFHFATLESLLNDVFLNLNPLLRKSGLVATLIDRFLTFHKFESDISTDLNELEISDKEKLEISDKDLFDTFWKFYLRLYEMDPELPAEEHSLILQSFIKLTLTYDPENFENLDRIYKFSIEKLTGNDDEENLWLLLLVAPVKHFNSTKNLLNLPFFHEFYLKLSKKSLQKQISLEIVDKILQDPREDDFFTTTDEIDSIFKYLLVLIKDSDNEVNTSKSLGVTRAIKIKNGEAMITQDFLITQEKICKLIHLVENKNPYKSLSNLMYLRKRYLNKNPENIIYTYPTLIARILYKLKLIGFLSMNKNVTNSNKDLLITSNFKNLSVILDELYQHHQEFNSALILKTYLNCAAVADQLKQESISYELYTTCFVIYEENWTMTSISQHNNPHDPLSGSIPYQSIVLIANKLITLRYFSKENYENLITKVTLYGSKLLKKQDQCRSVYYCSHLWWWCDLFVENSPTVTDAMPDNDKSSEKKGELFRDPKRVLECLQKALRIADSCMDPYLSLKLFVEILNRCLIFNIYGNPLIDSRYINGLIDLIKTNVDNLKDNNLVKDSDDNEFKLFTHISNLFERTLRYIEEQQASEGRFDGVIV